MRIDISVLVTDADDHVLLVHPGTGTRWRLPTATHTDTRPLGEIPAQALAAETGLHRPVTTILGIDHTPADTNTGGEERVVLVCDGGRLTSTEREAAAVPDSATTVTKVRWIPFGFVGDYVTDTEETRIHTAYHAQTHGTLPLRLGAGASS
ncbi:NUDIX hydrolase [Streptomyces clavuligerus]|uniref:NUDIX hydrolase n=1 Tax=Streptomyces clavuligerus TaxID=1901 RepID=UPI0018D0F155|nr:NUDIX hydrolase [Streptomyces clavuligerus]